MNKWISYADVCRHTAEVAANDGRVNQAAALRALAAELETASALVSDAWDALNHATANGFKLRASIPANPKADHDLRIGAALELLSRLAAGFTAPLKATEDEGK